MKQKTCENCLRFVPLYSRHGASFTKAAYGQCNIKNPRKKYEIKNTVDTCEKWDDIAASFEKKGRGLFELLESVSTQLATVEILLREIYSPL